MKYVGKFEGALDLKEGGRNITTISIFEVQ